MTDPGTSRGHTLVGPLAMLVLAGALTIGPWEFKSPVAPAGAVPARASDPTPVRRPSFKPVVKLAGFTYACSDCHRLFESQPDTARRLTQHRDIVLEHGINTRCLNCHHRQNRNAFVDDAGGEIPYGEPQMLCARCHGLVFRDWQKGVHGRTSGFWEGSRGSAQRLRCTECHDPHRPPFAALTPAPPPHTLRMGDQSRPHPVDEHDPLRIFRQRTTPEQP